MSIDVTTDLEMELVDGATMSREHFMRAYEMYPDNTSFELIEGTVHMASPVSNSHQRNEKLILRLFDRYELETEGVDYIHEQTLHLGEDTTVEPDVLVRLLEEYGGECVGTSDDYLAGPPLFVVEVSNSSLSFDLNRKRRAYARFGVLEYLVIDLVGRRFHWFDLSADEVLTPDADGVCRLRNLPGCWLAVEPILNDDIKAALPTLHAGLASPEHAAFVADLAARRTPPQS